jgi:hypothetical protein
MFNQGILKGEVSLYHGPPVCLVWVSVFCKNIVSSHTADSKPVRQEVKGTVILPPLVFPDLIFNNLTGMHDRRVLDPFVGSGDDPGRPGTRIREIRIVHRSGFEPDVDDGDAADVFPDQQVHVGFSGHSLSVPPS